MIHYNGSHTHQRMIFKRAAVYQRVVPYRNVITYVSRRIQVSSMNNSPILYIGVVAYFNVVYIATYYRVEPYRAIIAHDHIANNGRVFGDKAIGSPTWVF